MKNFAKKMPPPTLVMIAGGGKGKPDDSLYRGPNDECSVCEYFDDDKCKHEARKGKPCEAGGWCKYFERAEEGEDALDEGLREEDQGDDDEDFE